MGCTAVPASTNTICFYATFLARTLKFNSIRNYLNIIGVLHKEFGLPNPLLDNWAVKSLLTGVKHVKGNAVKQSFLLLLLFFLSSILYLT